MYYPLAIREAAPSNSEAEVATEKAREVPEEGLLAAITSGEPIKEVDPPVAVETSKGPAEDIPLPADPLQAAVPSEGHKDSETSSAQPPEGGVEMGLKE
nr:hypothetical protein CFP56_52595 [Quercus suber]